VFVALSFVSFLIFMKKMFMLQAIDFDFYHAKVSEYSTELEVSSEMYENFCKKIFEPDTEESLHWQFKQYLY